MVPRDGIERLRERRAARDGELDAREIGAQPRGVLPQIDELAQRHGRNWIPLPRHASPVGRRRPLRLGRLQGKATSRRTAHGNAGDADDERVLGNGLDQLSMEPESLFPRQQE